MLNTTRKINVSSTSSSHTQAGILMVSNCETMAWVYTSSTMPSSSIFLISALMASISLGL